MAIDSSFEGVALDPSKCSKISMEEKRELVYEVSSGLMVHLRCCRHGAVKRFCKSCVQRWEKKGSIPGLQS
ncbi:hypothetical protein SESBI_50687 [Sesbania bispinosa]|nr:hypothetical protein SESBI_50687 [Sesbania bispinosa]